MRPGRPLTRKKEAAIAALLSAGTIEQAAQIAGISGKTLHNWMAQADFASEYRRARQQVVEAAIGSMQAASLEAVDALRRNLNCGRPASEIAAANSLLERSTAAIEQFDILGRLEALEAQAALKEVHHAYGNSQTNGEAHRGPGR
jgi:hypothetical protein